jgi:hypothetical protein
MSGARLHAFDLLLTEYALFNVRTHLVDAEFKALAERDVDPPTLAYMLALGDLESTPAPRLLSDADFDDLALAIDGEPHLDPNWQVDERVHRRSLDTVTEVRASLGNPAADEWAQTSARLAAQLERVWLHEGLELVGEWSHELRRLLKAMQATAFLPPPAGTFPTPRFALPLSEDQLRDVQTMREAISASLMKADLPPDAKGRHALPDILIGTVDIRNKNGRRALRVLEALGEYEGFARRRPRRYEEGRPNQR